MKFRRIALGAFFLTLVFVISEMPALAANSGESNRIIATGKQREQIKATPIVRRPNRPLHFYGNTVRRVHHRRTH